MKTFIANHLSPTKTEKKKFLLAALAFLLAIFMGNWFVAAPSSTTPVYALQLACALAGSMFSLSLLTVISMVSGQKLRTVIQVTYLVACIVQTLYSGMNESLFALVALAAAVTTLVYVMVTNMKPMSVIAMLLALVFSAQTCGAQDYLSAQNAENGSQQEFPPSCPGDNHQSSIALLVALTIVALAAGGTYLYYKMSGKCNQLGSKLNNRFDDQEPGTQPVTNYIFHSSEFGPVPITPPVWPQNLGPGDWIETNVTSSTFMLIPISELPGGMPAPIDGGPQYVVTAKTTSAGDSTVSITLEQPNSDDCEQQDDLVALGLNPVAQSYSIGGRSCTQAESGMSYNAGTSTVTKVIGTARPVQTAWLESRTSLSEPWRRVSIKVRTDHPPFHFAGPAAGSQSQYFRVVIER